MSSTLRYMFSILGVVIIEGMACKKPVMASRVAGIVDIIENEKTGILVKPDNPGALANAVMALLQDKELWGVIFENGYASVQQRFLCKHNDMAYEEWAKNW